MCVHVATAVLIFGAAVPSCVVLMFDCLSKQDKVTTGKGGVPSMVRMEACCLLQPGVRAAQNSKLKTNGIMSTT